MDKKMTKINTLQQLADFINANDEWKLETERIIEANGWISDCGTAYGICHIGNEFVEFNEKGEATVTTK